MALCVDCLGVAFAFAFASRNMVVWGSASCAFVCSARMSSHHTLRARPREPSANVPITPGFCLSCGSTKSKQEYKTVSDHLKSANQDLTDLYHALRDYMMNLGDDVQEKTLKYYFAYKRIKKLCLCGSVYPKQQTAGLCETKSG